MENLNKTAQDLCGILPRPKDTQYIGLEKACEEAIKSLMIAMFPYHVGKARERFNEEEKRYVELMHAYDALSRAFSHVMPLDEAEKVADKLLKELPNIMQLIKTDITAAYEGDPAAKSIDEVILSYPAFKAISIYRIAHKLYEMNVYLIPRLFTEYAHSKTGIDIHPGATIGPYFFIDHGTGVVIGETTTIGEHVKLYQHVTLGAKSFTANPDGSLVKGIKRHPDIGNNVVIYAGATILGGDTKIGDNCVIGSSVWLTHSVPAGKTVTIKVEE